MKLFSAAALPIFFAEEGTARTIRLRNKNVYKSAGSQRQLQPEITNIFDGTADSTTDAMGSTGFSVVLPSFSLSLPPILTPPILSIPPTLSFPAEPIMDAELSMSAPGAPVFPDTIPAIDTTVMPTDIPPQTTALAQITDTNEFSLPEDITSISMSLSISTEPTAVTATTTSTTAAATTTISTTSPSPASVTKEPTSTAAMCMSMPAPTASTEMPSGGEEDESISIPQVNDVPDPPLGYIPPTEESAPTTMPTNLLNIAGDSLQSSAHQTGKSCVTAIAAVAAAGFHMLFLALCAV